MAHAARALRAACALLACAVSLCVDEAGPLLLRVFLAKSVNLEVEVKSTFGRAASGIPIRVLESANLAHYSICKNHDVTSNSNGRAVVEGICCGASVTAFAGESASSLYSASESTTVVLEHQHGKSERARAAVVSSIRSRWVENDSDSDSGCDDPKFASPIQEVALMPCDVPAIQLALCPVKPKRRWVTVRVPSMMEREKLFTLYEMDDQVCVNGAKPALVSMLVSASYREGDRMRTMRSRVWCHSPNERVNQKRVKLSEQALSKGSIVNIRDAPGSAKYVTAKLRRKDRFGRFGCELETGGGIFGLESVASPISHATTVASEAAGSTIRGKTRYVAETDIAPACLEPSLDKELWKIAAEEIQSSELVFFPQGSISIGFSFASSDDAFSAYYLNLLERGTVIALEDGSVIGEIKDAEFPGEKPGRVVLVSGSLCRCASGMPLCVYTGSGNATRLQKTELVIQGVAGGGVVTCYGSHLDGTHASAIVYICLNECAHSLLQCKSGAAAYNSDMASGYASMSLRLQSVDAVHSDASSVGSGIDICFVDAEEWFHRNRDAFSPWWAQMEAPAGTAVALVPSDAHVTVSAESVVFDDGQVFTNEEGGVSAKDLFQAASFDVMSTSVTPSEIMLMSADHDADAQNKVRQLRHEAERIEALRRKRSAEHEKDKNTKRSISACHLQRVFRGFSERQKTNKAKERVTAAASKIQHMFRCRASKQRVTWDEEAPWDASLSPDDNVTERMRRQHMKPHTRREKRSEKSKSHRRKRGDKRERRKKERQKSQSRSSKKRSGQRRKGDEMHRAHDERSGSRPSSNHQERSEEEKERRRRKRKARRRKERREREQQDEERNLREATNRSFERERENDPIPIPASSSSIRSQYPASLTSLQGASGRVQNHYQYDRERSYMSSTNGIKSPDPIQVPKSKYRVRFDAPSDERSKRGSLSSLY